MLELIVFLSTWNYSEWPWLNDVDRDIEMSQGDGRDFYESFKKLVLNEKRFKIAVKDGYDAVPWARSAPCATTTSAVLEQAFKDAGLPVQAEIFGKHDKFGPTHNVEIMLYRMGWNYYSTEKYEIKAGIGLLGGRFTWNGTPKHSGHIYSTMGTLTADGEVVIADNTGYNHVYRGPGYKSGTEGFWLPPGVEAEPLD